MRVTSERAAERIQEIQLETVEEILNGVPNSETESEEREPTHPHFSISVNGEIAGASA